MVTNFLNSKKYVGITSQSIEKRWIAHVSASRKPACKSELHKEIKLFGRQAFRVQELETHATYRDLLVAEKRLILEHGTLHPSGYNMTAGGQGTVGYKWKIEDRKKLSLKTKGRSMEHAILARKARGRRTLTAEHKAKISQSHVGKKQAPHTEEHKAKLRAALLGRPTSPETKQKLKEAALRRWSDKAERDKLSVTAKNRPRQPGSSRFASNKITHDTNEPDTTKSTT